MSTPRPRLVIYGIDGADWHIASELVAAGELPNLAALAREGAFVPLRSIIPPITSCAWPTIMTGTNPGKHGMFNFVAATGDQALLTNANRLVPALWEILDSAGLSVGCFSVPFTYPPDQLSRGFIFAGEVGAPQFDRRMFQPPELFDEARRVVPTYSLDLPVVLGRVTATDRFWERFVQDRHRLCLHLLENHPADVFIAVVNYVDFIQHAHMVHRQVGSIDDIVRWAYRQADELLGEIRRSVGEDVPIIVLSDHGAGPIEGFIDVPGLLAHLGFLVYTEKRAAGRHAFYKLASRAYRAIASRLPGFLRRGLRRASRRFYLSNITDWAKTTAFYAGPYSIVINTEGRSPHPSVRKEDREKVARQVADAINDMVSPVTGQKDIHAYLREEIYHGPALERCPDIILATRDFKFRLVKGLPGAKKIFWAPEEVTGREFITQWIEGDHRFEGILLVSPPPDEGIETAELADVAPTALSLLGLPVPEYMDGRSLVGEASPRVSVDASRERPTAEQVYSADEAAAVEKRLRDLGYL